MLAAISVLPWVISVCHAWNVEKPMTMEESQASDSLAALLLAFPHIKPGHRSVFASSLSERIASNLHPNIPADIAMHQTGARLSSSHVQMMAGIAKGSNVLVYGGGPMQCLVARIAAIQGFKTSLIVRDGEVEEAEELCYDETHAIGSLPLTLVPISGENADESVVNQTVAAADGLIIAFDNQAEILSEKALNILMPSTSKIKHVSLMSRSLNGEGMGFWGNAARVASNQDVWAAPEALIPKYREAEAIVKARASECGATFTIVRVGTLKGGATGGDGESGESSFLNSIKFYSMGPQDIVNWRLLFDNQALDFELVKGDKIAGPGLRAIWDSRDKLAEGDCHRGAAAAALVEALRTPAAHNSDFGVRSKEGRKFPTPEEIASLYEKA